MKAIIDLMNDGKKKFDIIFYQEYIKKLYSNINEKRDFQDIYGYLHRNIGYLGKSIESKQMDQTKFVIPISWLFSLSTKLNINLLEALIKKFPGLCPYCLESQCMCYKTNKKPQKSLFAYEIRAKIDEARYYKWEEVKSNQFNYNLEVTTEFIKNIYPYNEVVWKFSGYQIHLLKIHQEMTEIHEAYSRYKKVTNSNDKKLMLAALGEEIADVFAWILSAWTINYPDDSIDKAFINYYNKGCPVCNNMPCTCNLDDSPATTLPDFSKIEKLKQNIIELGNIFPDYTDEVNDLLRSYWELEQTQSIPIVRATLLDTRKLILKIQKKAIILDESGRSASYLSSIIELFETLLQDEGEKISSINKFDIFLSHSSKDIPLAEKMFDYFENQNKEVFMSGRSIDPSNKWKDVIKNALKRSKFLCVLVTPDSLGSDWVKTEISSAWITDIPIIPVLYRVDINSLPETLKDYQAIDYSDFEGILKLLEKAS